MGGDRRVKQWIRDHVMPVTCSMVDILRLLFLLVFVYLVIFHSDLMETTVEVQIQFLLILYLLLGLPNLIDSFWRLWRFLRTLGEIEPPGKHDREVP